MPIEANLLTAQSVLETDAGISALGIGWQVRPPEPIPWAIFVVFRSTRDLIETQHSATVRLEYEGGEAVDEGLSNLLDFDINLEPEGLTDAGLVSPVVRGFGANLLPIPLEPGAEFRFRLWVDGETRDHWVAPFRTTPP
jgi:hypothetical protein